MPKPTPGKPYVAVSGDTLTRISLRAYGIASRWRDIWEANETSLRSGDPNLIFVGEVITIPENELIEEIQSEISGKDRNQFTLLISGEELPVTSGRILLTADTAANGWSASRALDPGDEFTNENLRPFKYPEAKVFLGNEKVDTGFLYRVQPKLQKEQRIIELHGWSSTADIIDSVVKSPFQENRVTLKQRTESMLKGRGVALVFESENDSIFKRVKTDKTTKIFEHLSKLATQRGILISCTELGELLMYDPTTDGSIGTLEEGQGSVKEFDADFDGRSRYNVYMAYGKGPKKNKKSVSKDDAIPKSRMIAFQADDTTGGDIEAAANYQRNKTLADAMTISLPVGSWYGPDNKLWKPNTMITVISPTLFLPDGFTFFIRSVEFEFDPGETSAVLNLVPPTVYTREELIDPWAEV